MRLFAKKSPGPQGTPSPLHQLSRDEDGATAVEFAIISVPFITMLLGIISVCLYFFTVLELENAVWGGSRDIRVGTYGNEIGAYAKPAKLPTETQAAYDARVLGWQQRALKTSICNRMRDPSTCESKLKIILQSRPAITSTSGAGAIEQPNCRKLDGSLIDNNAIESTSATSFVILTACFPWEFGGKLPFFKIGNMPDGSFLVQATFAFVNENYN
jgi:Flp pilus assembly pilin Flp